MPQAAPHQPARAQLAKQALSAHHIARTMGKLFPRRNDYGQSGYEEVLAELAERGITTLGTFSRLMKAHRRLLLVMDRHPLAPWEIHLKHESFPDPSVRDALRRQYWFAYPALIRIALELQFGTAREPAEA